MNRTLRATVIIILLLTLTTICLTLVITTRFGFAQTGTNISGIIASDITWTKANSPYTLTGNTALNQTVTLTIEPGVTVNLATYYLRINGTLRVQGTSNDPIHINGSPGSTIKFYPSSAHWVPENGTGCTIQNAVLDSVSLMVYATSPKIDNDTFIGTVDPYNINTKIYVGGGAPLITNNTITGSGSAVAGITCDDDRDFNIDPLMFQNKALISSNLISCPRSGVYVAGGNMTVENNIIINSVSEDTAALNLQSLAYPNIALIRNNTIANNLYAVRAGQGSIAPTIINNNIFGNTHNVWLTGFSNINVTNNWWGTTNTQTINASIYDFKNDFNLGVVSFVPFLGEPNPAAPIIPSFQISASANVGGSITPSGSINVNYGLSQTFNITANTGYHTLDVAVNGSSVGAVSTYTLNNVRAAYNILATFAPNPTPTPVPTPTPTPSPTPTLAPSPTPAPTPSPAPSPTQPVTPIPTTAPTPSPSPSPYPSPSPSPSLNPNPTATMKPTATLLPTPSPSVPEFPSYIILSIAIIAVTLTAFVTSRNRRVSNQTCP